MTEVSQVHDPARRHLAPYGRYERFEHRYDDGWPDVYYVLLGVSGWIENKLIPPSGRCPEKFTLEQLLWGEAEVAAGGRWHLLGRCSDMWRLYDAQGARAWRGGTDGTWILNIAGRFPLHAIIDCLAPRHLRRPSQSTIGKALRLLCR